jgi:hypothetical protein
MVEPALYVRNGQCSGNCTRSAGGDQVADERGGSTGPSWTASSVPARNNRVTLDGDGVPCFRQKKSDLRKGDGITFMKNLYLDELAVGGGDDTGMLRPIKKAELRVGPSG